MTASTATTDFSGHTPGQPYSLTREEFVQFIGQKEAYQMLHATFACDCSYSRSSEAAFWATLSFWEAARTFNPFANFCHSQLEMTTQGGKMTWQYQTTSGTVFSATEWREFETRSAPGYPGRECSDEIPAPVFTVTIPAERDQPGRYHYEQLRQLRNGGCYCN